MDTEVQMQFITGNLERF